MNAAIGLSASAYGFGAGIFFFGYTAFEIPSNLLLVRFGARRWIARIAIAWGATSAAMMFVQGPWSFYALRLLLGVSEAGFFPGIIYYLTRWIPALRPRPHDCDVHDGPSHCRHHRWSAFRRLARRLRESADSTAGNGCSWRRACRPSSSAFWPLPC